MGLPWFKSDYTGPIILQVIDKALFLIDHFTPIDAFIPNLILL